MLKELERYYYANGILSTAFNCSFKEQCSHDCDAFTGPKSAFVGSGYEGRSLPRLLFISLDSGSAETHDEKRLPAAIRQQEEIDLNVQRLHKGKHWYLTHELAWYILREFKPDLRLDEARQFFAHTNSAKCCMNKPHRTEANAVLFRNCRAFLRGELSLLKPEFIVTQGSEAKSGIESVRSDTIHRFDKFASSIVFDGREVFWLHTYHPRAFGAFYKQRDFEKASKTARGWVRYATLMREFLANSKRPRSG